MRIIASSRLHGEHHYDAYISSCSYCACGTQQFVPRFDRRLGFRPWGLRPAGLCGTAGFCGTPAGLCSTAYLCGPADFCGPTYLCGPTCLCGPTYLCGTAYYGSAVLFLVTL
jgi:hypothetical protein